VLEIAAKDFDDDEKVSLKISAFSMWTWMLEGVRNPPAANLG